MFSSRLLPDNFGLEHLPNFLNCNFNLLYFLEKNGLNLLFLALAFFLGSGGFFCLGLLTGLFLLPFLLFPFLALA
ncbi:MAG: hypothetical protein ABFS09_12320, partial [Thermodesulfobacteriota bacterium]